MTARWLTPGDSPMTDTKALIAEARDIEAEASARAAQALTQGQGAPAAFLSRVAQNARRLAAAMEEATVPDGWRVTEYRAEQKRVWAYLGGAWAAESGGRRRIIQDAWANSHTPTLETFPTAREAMAALDGAAIDTSTRYVENP